MNVAETFKHAIAPILTASFLSVGALQAQGQTPACPPPRPVMHGHDQAALAQFRADVDTYRAAATACATAASPVAAATNSAPVPVDCGAGHHCTVEPLLGNILKVNEVETTPSGTTGTIFIGQGTVPNGNVNVQGATSPENRILVMDALGSYAKLQSNGAVPVVAPLPPPTPAPVSVAAGSEPTHPLKPQVAFNATGDEVTVSGADLRYPVKLKVDFKTPKGSDAIPAGVSAEIDQEHGGRAPVTVTTVTFNGGLEPASAGAHVGSFVRGGARVLLNSQNSSAAAAESVCSNPDNCFTEVDATGSTKFTRTVGGFEQDQYKTRTGRSPVADMQASTMSDIRYALTATRQAMEDVKDDGQKAPNVAVFKAALGTPRFQREDAAMDRILAAAGYKTTQPQVH